MKILHITQPQVWKDAQSKGIYKADTLKSDGYIHCCLPDQLDGVLQQWFQGAAGLVILEVDTDKLSDKVVYENLEGGAEKFPHIYGPIPLEAVITVKTR